MKLKIEHFFLRISYFFYKIKRLFEYFPIIWKTHDWDYSYSIDIFRYQLQRTLKSFEKNEDLTRNYEQQRLKTILKLMDLVYDHKYELEFFDIMQEKYGKYRFLFDKDPDFIRYKVRISYEGFKDLSQEEIEKAKEEENEIMLMCDKKQEKAHRILWKLIEHNIRDFW